MQLAIDQIQEETRTELARKEREALKELRFEWRWKNLYTTEYKAKIREEIQAEIQAKRMALLEQQQKELDKEKQLMASLGL